MLELCRCETLRRMLAEERRDDVVHLCAAVLTHAHVMLDKFTLPTSSPFDIFIDSKCGVDILYFLELYPCVGILLRFVCTESFKIVNIYSSVNGDTLSGSLPCI